MQKLTFSVLHFFIITCVSLAILLGVAYATVLNENFWLKNISTHTLVPPSASSTSALTQDTTIMSTVLKALPQKALQAEATAFTKATFGWLRGESERLDYRPNLEAFKPQIVASLQQKYLAEFQANSIACPATGVFSDPETGVTIHCSPTQDPTALAELYAQSVASAAVAESASQQPAAGQSESIINLPQLYQLGHALAWVMPVVTALFIVLTITVAPEKWRQASFIARHISYALVPSILVIGGGLLLMSVSLQLSPQAIADLQQYGLGGLLREVTRQTSVLYLIVSTSIMIVAIMTWLATRHIAKQTALDRVPPAQSSKGMIQ